MEYFLSKIPVIIIAGLVIAALAFATVHLQNFFIPS